jgi:hypothetical protein
MLETLQFGVRGTNGMKTIRCADCLPVGHTETLALDHTGAALTDEGLFGRNSNSDGSGVVVRDGGRRRAGLVVLAPVVLVDGQLTGGTGTPRSATGTRSLALGAGEVEGLLQDDNTSGGVAKVRDQLGIGLEHIISVVFSSIQQVEKDSPLGRQERRFHLQ